MTERKPSEIIQDFLNLLEIAQHDHDEAYKLVGVEDKRLNDFLHELEFSVNKQERNKVATKFQQSRKLRRVAKDEVELYRNVVNFAGNASHKATIRDLRTALGMQIRSEEYVFGEREYKERMPIDG